MRVATAAMVALAAIAAACAAESLTVAPARAGATRLEPLVGQPVEIAPWAYAWRADRAVQEKAEAYFIPRRLERIDKVYRTAFTVLPQDRLKSIYYDMPDLLKPLLPPPRGRLQAALLWTGGLSKYRVELHWPGGLQAIRPPDTVEVRVYPTSFGWFGWTVDKLLSNPVVSADRRTWTYTNDPAAKMDSGYSTRADAATEMVAVFYEDGTAQAGVPKDVPSIRVMGPNLGEWKRMDLEVGTNSDGRAVIRGLPDKARPMTYDIQKDGRKAVADQDVAKTCEATLDVTLP